MPSLLLAVAMIALMGLSPARQAGLINAWSLQYARHALNPTPSRATWKSGGRNYAASSGQPYALHPIRPLGRTVGEKDHGNRGGEELYALRDVSFAVVGSKVVVK